VASPLSVGLHRSVLRRDETTLCCAFFEIKEASVLQEAKPKGETKLEGVRMTMGALDCPICYEPLVPAIYQVGSYIASSVSLKKTR
jgi:hypothetical protein